MMCPLLKFTNQTTYPVISVEEDDRTVVRDLLRGETSPYQVFSAGSVTVIVRQQTQTPFLNLLLPLAPDSTGTLVIHDEGAYFS